MTDTPDNAVPFPAAEPSKDEVNARLAAAAGRPVFVKLSDIPKDAVPFVTSRMVRARAGCKHCHGKGTLGAFTADTFHPVLGKTVKAGTAIPCRCLLVDATAIKAAVLAEQARLEAGGAEPAPDAEPSTEGVTDASA